MKQILLICGAMVLLGCGKKAPEQQANVPDANPPAKAKATPGMKAAKKTLDAGNYREAVRLYTVELAAEEAKPVPSWVQLSYLHNQLGSTLDYAGLYDKALEHHQKALAIYLKKLGSEHPHVARSYNNIGSVHYKKREYDKALENYQKALEIDVKRLGPEHPGVATSYINIGSVHHVKGDYDKALENFQRALGMKLKQLGLEHPDVARSYWWIGVALKEKNDISKAKEFIGKSHTIFLKKLGPNHPDTKNAKAELDALKE